MAERIGIAVVGAGFMGGVHASVFGAEPRSSVRWVVDLDGAAATELAGRTGARATRDLDEALADEAVRLVVVATPPTTHGPLAERTLAAGRNVLVEKPLVPSSAEAARLAGLARERGLVLACGGNFLHAPKFVRAKQLVQDEGALGTVHHVRVTYRTSGPDSDWFRRREVAGGGALTDIGWHAIELTRWLLGKPELEAVTAWGGRVTDAGDVEEQAVALLHFANGAVGHCDVSWLCPGGEQLTVEVLGTAGRVVADLWQGMGISAYTDASFADVWEPNAGWTFPEWEWIRNSGYVHQDRQLLAAILDGAPLAHAADDAVAVVRALEAAYESADSGRRVELTGGRVEARV
jgi:predicted dehydrogenase